MDDKKDKANIYNQDMIFERQSFSNKVYNYFYTMLKEKKEISFFRNIYIVYIRNNTINIIRAFGASYNYLERKKLNFKDSFGHNRYITNNHFNEIY